VTTAVAATTEVVSSVTFEATASILSSNQEESVVPLGTADSLRRSPWRFATSCELLIESRIPLKSLWGRGE